MFRDASSQTCDLISLTCVDSSDMRAKLSGNSAFIALLRLMSRISLFSSSTESFSRSISEVSAKAGLGI
ncbi:unnamed protein product [Trichobilharzia regenti]|nr:unnamed protein product [Trichobilharzia regenti]